MKSNILILSFILSFVFSLTNAQNTKTDSIAKVEIAKLSFMNGKWTGSGWMIGQDGVKHEFTQTEDVQIKLDGTVLLIEGLGKRQGVVTHNALAMVSYDKEGQHYNFHSQLASGISGDFKAELIDKKFYWYPNDFIRYILYLNEAGQWYEIGEMNRGGNWVQFFEMTLSKKYAAQKLMKK